MPNLNPQQLEAVNANEERVLALAGAGSGKTSVLTYRIARLLSDGVMPEEIMAVTFTKKASEEMRTRIADLLKEKQSSVNPKRLVMGTFHSIFNEVVLKKVCTYFGRTLAYKIIDPDDKDRILRSLIRDKQFIPLVEKIELLESIPKLSKFQKDEHKRLKEEVNVSIRTILKDASAYIEAAKSFGYTPKNAPKSGDFDYAKKLERETDFKTLLKVYVAYEDATFKSNVFDFDDLMLCPYIYLTESQNIQMIDALRSPFKHYLVDEFQDTSALQYKLMTLMAKDASLFIVGDDDQSLYGFRNADVGNIMDFSKNPERKTYRYVVLDRNYRSEGNILSSANSVISNNKQRLGKNLWTDSIKGARLPVASFDGLPAEAKWIGSEIQKRIRDGLDPNEIAVLYRINRIAKPITLELDRLRIPYEEINGYDFFKRMEVKAVIGYLKLLTNPNMFFTEIDNIANVPQKGIGEISLSKIKKFVAIKINEFFENENRPEDAEFDLLGALELLLKEGKDSVFYMAPKTKEGLNQFVRLMEEMFIVYNNHMADKTTVKTSDLVSSLLNFKYDDGDSIADYFRDLDSEEISEEDMGRIDNIQKLVYKMDDGDDVGTNINNLMLTASGDSKNGRSKDGVKLMTVHGAKGLEFHTVFIAGAKNGLFPMGKGDMEEERRVFYVAVTRAKKECLITYSVDQAWYSNGDEDPASPFIKEINKSLLERSDLSGNNANSGGVKRPNPVSNYSQKEMWLTAQKYANKKIK